MKSRGRSILSLFAVGVLAATVLTGCVPSGPLTAEQIAGEFDDEIQPAWSVEVPGIFGEAAVEGGLVAVYAQDEEDGMRLEVHDTKTGDLVWKHVASPGGSWGAPILTNSDSISRLNPIPAIRPFIVTRGTGDKAKPVVVFTERVITEEQMILNDDILRIADLRTGDLLELTAPDDEDGMWSPDGTAYTDDDGNILVSAYSPFYLCGDGPTVCAEDRSNGQYVIDVGSLEVTNTEPEWDSAEVSRIREWGPGFVNDLDVSDEGTTITRLEDGEVLWSMIASELFDNSGTRPAEDRDFVQIGDLVLIQGYKPITPLFGISETLDYDYADSRTLVAVERDTGVVVWRLPGGDMQCLAVDGFRVTSKTEVFPVCHATGGSFSYSGDGEELLDIVDPEASIAAVDVKDGTIGWKVPHAGDQSILEHGRQLEAVFASGSTFAVVDATNTEDKKAGRGLVDLTTGEFQPVPDENAGYVCESERDGVPLEFEGSSFSSGVNPLAVEYPAGRYQFSCDQDGEAAKTWTKGAVRASGLPAAEGRVIVVTEDGLVGFAL